jgi:hemerythrin
MPLVVSVPNWDNKYNTGVDEIDYQHQYFLKLIKRFNVSIEKNIGDYLMKRYLQEIVKYAEFHFFSEENLMMLHDYPDIEIHRELHMKLIDQLTAKVNFFKPERKQLRILEEFLIQWFLDHTVKEDSKIAKYLNKR